MLGDLLNNEVDPGVRRYRARFCNVVRISPRLARHPNRNFKLM
jgi:hypothetical protein